MARLGARGHGEVICRLVITLSTLSLSCLFESVTKELKCSRVMPLFQIYIVAIQAVYVRSVDGDRGFLFRDCNIADVGESSATEGKSLSL